MNAVAKIKTLALTVALAFAITGCGLMPKKVEFFQDTVHGVPKFTPADTEVRKETAELAARKAQETYRAALKENSSTNVLAPAADTSLLTLSLSKSLGSPLSPWTHEADVLAAKLDHVEAKLDARLDKFAEKQQENVGKKIEGTGLFQVPYFVWLGGVALFFGVVLFVGFIVLQVVKISNPGVALGANVAEVGASRLAKGFVQTIKGNESFKNEVKAIFGETEAVTKTILEMFKRHQMVNQDTDIQATIKNLTSK